jgi:hypothetical protein
LYQHFAVFFLQVGEGCVDKRMTSVIGVYDSALRGYEVYFMVSVDADLFLVCVMHAQ